jgi:GDSL-like Lipase/Acylhydrolase family
VNSIKPSDLLILPIVGIVTIVLISFASEVGARFWFPEQLMELCTDGSGPGFKPNCVSTMKAAEGPGTTVEYNNCGYRSSQTCGSKPAGGIRVAILGSSISRGYAVAYPETLAARAEVALTGRCGRPVDFQNVSIMWPTSPSDPRWATIQARTDEALRLDPDMLLVFVSSWDLSKYHATQEATTASPQNAWKSSFLFRALSSVARYLRDELEHSRAVLIVRHILYLDAQLFVESYLKNGDEAGYLRTPFSSEWTARLSMLDRIIEAVSRSATAAGVRVAVVFVPFEPQVLLARTPAEPGTDPHAFEQAIGAISSRYRALFIDPLPQLAAAATSVTTYYRVNGHPNSEGHAIIAQTIISDLEKEPAFENCRIGF